MVSGRVRGPFRFRGPVRAGLTALDFVKVSWVVEGTKRGLKAMLPSLEELAMAEGLPNHFLSAQSRFRKR